MTINRARPERGQRAGEVDRHRFAEISFAVAWKESKQIVARFPGHEVRVTIGVEISRIQKVCPVGEVQRARRKERGVEEQASGFPRPSFGAVGKYGVEVSSMQSYECSRAGRIGTDKVVNSVGVEISRAKRDGLQVRRARQICLLAFSRRKRRNLSAFPEADRTVSVRRDSRA
jgi:hypothetical protein